MNLVVVGASHHKTPVEIRERLAFSPGQVQQALEYFQKAMPHVESVLVSTCNRTELYFACSKDDGEIDRNVVESFLSTKARLNPGEIGSHLYTLEDRNTLEHLFKVASSLDSMVLGESQIITQIRSAFDLAKQVRPQLPIMDQIFQSANSAAKQIASKTSIHRHRVSIASVAVSGFAKDIFETLHDKRVLIVGAGEMALETLVYLKDQNVSDIHLVNRSSEKAQQLADQFDGHAHLWDDLPDQLVAADLVVSATGATEYIVTAKDFQSIQNSRQQKTLIVLDLAIPRDFDPKIEEENNVYLYSVDDLKAQCERNRQQREAELPKAFGLIHQNVDKFTQKWNMQFSGPALKELKSKANQIKEDELRRLVNKLNAGDDPSVQKELEIAFDRLVNKILHPAMDSLRKEAQHGAPRSLVDSLRRLFQLGE